MNSQIGLGVFGTFGEPHGFQQVFYYGAHFRGSLDLDDNAIEFYPGANLYSIRREIVDGVHSICICVYSYVQELNTTRMGTFLGSCMVLQDGFTEADYIYKVLHSLHEDLMSNEDNVADNIINVAQGADIIIREPAEFVAVQANVIPLNRTPFFSAYVDDSKKYLVVPSPHAFGNNEKEVIDFIDEALKHYSDTGTLYFSFDKNVYSFVGNADIIPLLEWDDFVGRKTQMQQSTAVRTKKGIQKIASPEPTEDGGEDGISEVAQQEYNAWLQEEERKEEESTDPYKPFLLWEEPEEVWTKEEVKYRVNEYNRLFQYTNTLIDYINEPVPDDNANDNRKRVLVAAILLLLIGGGAAVYYFGFYQPGQGVARLAAALPETPRSIQQSNIVTDSVAAITGVDSAISAEMASSPENNKVNRRQVTDVNYKSLSADLDALEARFDDKDEDAPSSPATATAIAPVQNSLAANDTKPRQMLTPAHTNTPVATTATSSSDGPAEAGGMPQINMPASPRANLPVSASYSGKTKPDPAWLNTLGTPVKPVAEATPKQTNTVTATVAAITNTPVATVQNKIAPTVPNAAKEALPVTNNNAGTNPVVEKATSTAPAVVASKNTSVTTPAITTTNIAPATLTKSVVPVATTTPSKATTIQATPASVATNTPTPVVAATVNTIAPTKQASVNVAPATTSAKATSAAATVSTQPVAKGDSNKPASTTGTTRSNLPQAPVISSGVSAGEMSRANAVVLPQLRTAPNPDQIKLKTLYPRPNGTITQRDIPILSQMGVKNKTLTQLTRLIIENAPEDVGKYYKGQELQYAAALLNSNRQAFQRIGDDYVCTADYLILHIPAIIKPKRPASFPK